MKTISIDSLLWSIAFILLLGVIFWYYSEHQAIETWKKKTIQAAAVYNQQKENLGCTKHTKVGHGRYSAYEYQVWKCPDDTNEYLVR